jgi:hypothetical protein
MQNFLIVISKNYWGANTSEKAAYYFLETFSEFMDIPTQNRISLFGNDVNVNSVKNILYDTICNLPETTNTLFVYMNGHGNQTSDTNGDEMKTSVNINETPKDSLDELYQLPDGSIIDDELTHLMNNAVQSNINLSTISPKRIKIFLISDHCSSGSMIDNLPDLAFDWISIGSSLDYQDSYITGDGNVMTINLINVLKKNREIVKKSNVLDFYKLLDTEMIQSFIGDIQTCTIHVSSEEMLTIHPFE